mgnify:CR=1 FL=1|jgi:hypothetical protein|tara:strand:- start:321 stop:509 length:189 start_codon:yes stop_codon:yes gene_type:complete
MSVLFYIGELLEDHDKEVLMILENIHSQLSEVIDNDNVDKNDLSFARDQLEEIRELFITEEE